MFDKKTEKWEDFLVLFFSQHSDLSLPLIAIFIVVTNSEVYVPSLVVTVPFVVHTHRYWEIQPVFQPLGCLETHTVGQYQWNLDTEYIWQVNNTNMAHQHYIVIKTTYTTQIKSTSSSLSGGKHTVKFQITLDNIIFTKQNIVYQYMVLNNTDWIQYVMLKTTQYTFDFSSPGFLVQALYISLFTDF